MDTKYTRTWSNTMWIGKIMVTIEILNKIFFFLLIQWIKLNLSGIMLNIGLNSHTRYLSSQYIIMEVSKWTIMKMFVVVIVYKINICTVWSAIWYRIEMWIYIYRCKAMPYNDIDFNEKYQCNNMSVGAR